MPSGKKSNRFFAIIDIGSNSIKMSIAKIHPKNYSIVIEEKESLRLLQSGESEITSQKAEQLIRILRHFADLAHGYDCEVLAVATSAMRRAKNRTEIMARVFKDTGLSIELITGDQETDYIIEATKHRFDLRKDSFWIVDIGGGSMEVAFVKDEEVLYKNSMPMGAVVLKDKFFLNKIMDDREIEQRIEDLALRIQNEVHFEQANQIIISGGTPAAIAKIIQARRNAFSEHLHGMTVKKEDLVQITQKICADGIEKWIDKYGINKNRADLILPALCLIQAFLNFADSKKYIVSRTGLREGAICVELERNSRN